MADELTTSCRATASPRFRRYHPVPRPVDGQRIHALAWAPDDSAPETARGRPTVLQLGWAALARVTQRSASWPASMAPTVRRRYARAAGEPSPTPLSVVRTIVVTADVVTTQRTPCHCRGMVTGYGDRPVCDVMVWFDNAAAVSVATVTQFRSTAVKRRTKTSTPPMMKCHGSMIS